MITGSSSMPDEDLRMMAVGLADGDIGKAAMIVSFVRPVKKAQQGVAPCGLAPAWEPTWPDEPKRTYVVMNADGMVCGKFVRENDLWLKGAGNAFSWMPTAGRSPYTVYAYDESTGDSGYLGTTDVPSFIDDNIGPDRSRPLPMEAFSDEQLSGLGTTRF